MGIAAILWTFNMRSLRGPTAKVSNLNENELAIRISITSEKLCEFNEEKNVENSSNCRQHFDAKLYFSSCPRRLLELVEDCGPLPLANDKCKLDTEATNKTANFPYCCKLQNIRVFSWHFWIFYWHVPSALPHFRSPLQVRARSKVGISRD